MWGTEAASCRGAYAPIRTKSTNMHLARDVVGTTISALMVQVAITVNSKRKAHVEPRTLLASLLREHLNLTGTHVGCDTSQCGSCTVLIDGRSAKSCTMFAVQADGSSVTTIEGLAPEGQLHPVQRDSGKSMACSAATARRA